jgi:hypothetical protein
MCCFVVIGERRAAVLPGRAFHQLGVRRAVHARDVGVEPALEVVAHGNGDRFVLRHPSHS